MFTAEQRDAVRERVLRLAQDDARVVAGAVVGSLAVEGGGDRYSDLDLTFAVGGEPTVAAVLDDWTGTLTRELRAVTLVDLERGPTLYRVFLLPGALQLDLSMTPAAEFRPAGPRFRLVFGETASAKVPEPRTAGSLFVSTPLVSADIFGWGVIYALHSRACIERNRMWQAEHHVSAVRDHALSLACLREAVTASQARGYDDLSTATLVRFGETLAGSLKPDALRAALDASLAALLHEGAEASLPNVDAVSSILRSPGW